MARNSQVWQDLQESGAGGPGRVRGSCDGRAVHSTLPRDMRHGTCRHPMPASGCTRRLSLPYPVHTPGRCCRVSGDRVPTVEEAPAKWGGIELAIDSQPAVRYPQSKVTKVLRGPRTGRCMECGATPGLAGAAFWAGSVLGILVGRWSKS